MEVAPYKTTTAQSAGAVEYTDYRGGLPNSKKYPGNDTEKSDGKSPALEIRGMWSTPSLPSLPGPLWPKVEAPDRILSMGQIEQTMCANKWPMLNCNSYIVILENI